MGEVAERVGRFVTAYSSDLRDESLDGQRVVVGGIVTGVRTVITKAKATMAIVTLEDLQGTIEVVVFPRLYEQTAGTWRDGEILLVAGRVDHKGEDVSLLADLAVDWDAAAAAGDRGLRPTGRGRRPRRGRPARSRRPTATGTATAHAASRPAGGRWSRSVPGQAAAAGVRGRSAPRRPRRPSRSSRPTRRRRVADRRRPPTLPPIAPAEPVSTYPETPGVAIGPRRTTTSRRSRTRRAPGSSPTRPPTPRSTPGRAPILHVRFAGNAPTDRVVGAMETFKTVMRDRPGATRVVIHVPGPGGGAPMELRRGVAYDAELLAEVRRRLGDGLVDLRLS